MVLALRRMALPIKSRARTRFSQGTSSPLGGPTCSIGTKRWSVIDVDHNDWCLSQRSKCDRCFTDYISG